jgi:hypothetical protein
VQHGRRDEPKRYDASSGDECAHPWSAKEVRTLVELAKGAESRLQARREIRRRLDWGEIPENE